MTYLKLFLLSTLVPASIIIGLPSALLAAPPQSQTACQRNSQSEACRISKIPELEKRLKGAEAQLKDLKSQNSFRLSWPLNLLPGLTFGAALFSLLPTLVFAFYVRELRKKDLGKVRDESKRRLDNSSQAIISRVDERLNKANTDIQSVLLSSHNTDKLRAEEQSDHKRQLIEFKDRLIALEQDVGKLRSEIKSESTKRHPHASPPLSSRYDAPRQVLEDLSVSSNLQPLPDPRLNSPIVQAVSEMFGRNSEYFKADSFKPMRATKDASQGRVNTAGASLLEFQPCAMGDASYLLFEDGHTSFLIPNASLPRLVQQLNNWKVDNDSPFRIVDSTSGELQLIQPARVSSRDGAIWLVDETGTIGL